MQAGSLSQNHPRLLISTAYPARGCGSERGAVLRTHAPRYLGEPRSGDRQQLAAGPGGDQGVDLQPPARIPTPASPLAGMGAGV